MNCAGEGSHAGQRGEGLVAKLHQTQQAPGMWQWEGQKTCLAVRALLVGGRFPGGKAWASGALGQGLWLCPPGCLWSSYFLAWCRACSLGVPRLCRVPTPLSILRWHPVPCCLRKEHCSTGSRSYCARVWWEVVWTWQRSTSASSSVGFEQVPFPLLSFSPSPFPSSKFPHPETEGVR